MYLFTICYDTTWDSEKIRKQSERPKSQKSEQSLRFATAWSTCLLRVYIYLHKCRVHVYMNISVFAICYDTSITTTRSSRKQTDCQICYKVDHTPVAHKMASWSCSFRRRNAGIMGPPSVSALQNLINKCYILWSCHISWLEYGCPLLSSCAFFCAWFLSRKCSERC